MSTHTDHTSEQHPLQDQMGRQTGYQMELSVLSYNILFPNTEGWWIYKYYHPDTPRPLSAWPHRRALIIDQISRADTDIVCLQETSERSFAEDFTELDDRYERVIHGRGMRMRCATFWRPEKLELIEAQHKYRTLLTLFRVKGHAGEVAGEVAGEITGSPKLLIVINVHLSGGPKPQERISQINQALKSAHQLIKRSSSQASSQASEPALIMCGDFNEDISHGPLSDFLASGELEAGARSALYPDLILSKSAKRHRFAPIRHALYESRPELSSDLRRGDEPLWVTLRAPHLIGRFCEVPDDAPRGDERSLADQVSAARERGLSEFRRYVKPSLISALRELFERFADLPSVDDASSGMSSAPRMSEAGAARWLRAINGTVDGTPDGELRGSERRAWEAQLTNVYPATALTFESWLEIPLRELMSGKWWAVAHDLATCGVALPDLTAGEPEVHREWLDHILCAGAIEALSWCEGELFDEVRSREDEARVIPHEAHPSDHLPVCAVFRVLA